MKVSFILLSLSFSFPFSSSTFRFVFNDSFYWNRLVNKSKFDFTRLSVSLFALLQFPRVFSRLFSFERFAAISPVRLQRWRIRTNSIAVLFSINMWHSKNRIVFYSSSPSRGETSWGRRRVETAPRRPLQSWFDPSSTKIKEIRAIVLKKETREGKWGTPLRRRTARYCWPCRSRTHSASSKESFHRAS